MRLPKPACFCIIENSSSVSRPGLSSTASGMPILPMSCSSAACSSVSTTASVELERFGDEPRVAADAEHVLAGVVVAVLGGAGQAVDQVAARHLELGGPLADGGFEVVVVVAQVVLIGFDREHVSHARHQFAGVDRFVEEVGRAQLDGAHARSRDR